MNNKVIIPFSTKKITMKKMNLDQVFTYNSISEFLISIGKPAKQDSDFSISRLEGYLSDEPMESDSFRLENVTCPNSGPRHAVGGEPRRSCPGRQSYRRGSEFVSQVSSSHRVTG